MLAESPRNRAVLDALESSAFIVSLDTEKPEGPVSFSRAAWHGGVTGGQMGSRWSVSVHSQTRDASSLEFNLLLDCGQFIRVDKPVEFIIWDNAKAAIMGEHSGTLNTSLLFFLLSFHNTFSSFL